MPAPTALILSDEPLIAALVGSLVELNGLAPAFPKRSERVADAIARLEPRLVLVDCDHAECVEPTFTAAREAGAVVAIFTHNQLTHEVTAIAARHGAKAFALPIEREELGRVLKKMLE